MTSGIYQLTFSNGDTYIGKSIDMEKRWEEHRESFLRNKASAKMQRAFKQCGFPTESIIVECHRDHLDLLEPYYIKHSEPVLNSVISACIDHDDFEVLQNNADLLLCSTADHLRTIMLQDIMIARHEDKELECEGRVNELVKEIDRLNKEGTTPIEADLIRELNESDDQIIKLQEMVTKLEQENTELRFKPWWKVLLRLE